MLLRTSEEQESRILARTGLAVVACLVLAVSLAVFNPFARGAAEHTAVTIDTPYAGLGVVGGTPVIMHGVRVGEVAAVTSRAEGGARLHLRLKPTPAAGLTDTLTMDFRPSNYFGVTGVNLIQGPIRGRPLRDGSRLDLVPRGNFTMQAFLSRVGQVTHGVVTPELASVVDRATRYVDGLTPLLETLLLIANTMTEVQTVSAERLVRNIAGIGAAAPSFADGLSDLVDRLDHTGLDVDENFFQDRFLATVQLASTGLFGSVGALLSSHVHELTPATEIVRALAMPVPGIAQPENISDSLVELRTRFERMFEGSSGQRALQVHVALDALAGVAAPLAAMGGPR